MKKKSIYIGMGGGYDILSAVMLSRKYSNSCVDVGGILNPKFIHFFENNEAKYKEEESVNHIINARRYKRNINGSFNNLEIEFIDAVVSKYINNRVTAFSIVNGNIELLVQYLESTYERVYFVDVGGDVLFGGKKDFMVKTPIIDAFSLKIADELCKIRIGMSEVIVLGLGFDGELPYENLKTNISKIETLHGVNDVDKLENKDIEYLELLYEKVKGRDGGKTVRLLIDMKKGNLRNNSFATIRNIWDFECWFGKIYKFCPRILAEFNPLTKATTYNEMIDLAAEFDIDLKRYKLEGEL